MKVFGRQLTIGRRKDPSSLEQQFIRERLSDSDVDSVVSPSMSPEQRGTRGYAGHSWTYVAINRIITMGASCPWAIVRNGEAIENHPLGALLDRPNPIQNMNTMLQMTLLSLELWGHAYWVIERKGKTPVELWPVPSNLMKPSKVENGLPAAYTMKGENGREIEYQAEDVVWFNYTGPASALDGVSPTGAAEAAIQTDIKALRANLDFFTRGALPALAIKTPGTVSDEGKARLREVFKQLYSGMSKWFRPILLENGMDLQELTSKFDGSWLELRQQLRQEILAIYGVPPALAGLFDNAQFGVSIREQRGMMWETCLMPRLAMIDEAINRQLVAQVDPNVQYAWQYKQVQALQPNFVELATAAATLIDKGIYNRDEVRDRLFGEEPIGGDWGTGFWGTFSTLQLADANGRAIEEPEVTTVSVPEPAKQFKAKSDERNWRRLSSAAREKLAKAIVNRQNAERKIIARVMRGWYDWATDQVLQKLRSEKSLHLATRLKDPKVNNLVFDVDVGTAELRKRLSPILEDQYKRNGEEALAQVSEGISFDIDNPRARELLAARDFQMKTIVETAQERCRNAIAQGLANGETFDQLEARVMDFNNSGKRHHAENVARTETGIVMDNAALEGYRQGGMNGKEWLSIVDERSRETHAEMDGTVVGIDEPFTLPDGIECDCPHGPELDAEDICNCRCTVAPAALED